MIEKTITSKKIYEGKVINLRIDTVELDDKKYSKREIIEHNGGSCVVAITDEGEIVLVKQYRKAADKFLLELPAGKINPSEDPKDCVKRELMEETGIRTDDIELLFKFYSTPGFCNEVIYVYKAKNLVFGEPQPDVDEDIEVILVSLDQAVKMIEKGEIIDAKTISGILAVRCNLSTEDSLL